MKQRILLAIILVLITLLWSGCASTPATTFYSLSASLQERSGAIDTGQEVALRIGPFAFPDYLQRPNIVTRSAGHRIEVAEFHRWAGSLEEAFHQTLGSNLGFLLNSLRVSVYPAEMRFEPDYYLTGDVIRFDGEFDGSAILEIRWTINAANDRNALRVKHSVLTESVSGQDYPALIDAYQRILERLSREMRAEVSAVLRGAK